MSEADKKLEDMLYNMDTPSVDDNAKKRAVSLAMAEFEAHQKEKLEKNEKSSQGILGWFRPTSNSNNYGRREKMAFSKKKFIYGGMATACVALFAVNLTTVMTDTISGSDSVGAPMQQSLGALSRIPDASILTAGVAESDVTHVMRDSLERRNQKDKERANQMGGSFIPQPIDPIRETLSAKTEIKKQGRQFAEGMPVKSVKPSSVIVEEEKIVADDVFAPDTYKDEGRDKFEDFETSPIKVAKEEPVSTFSVDVDTASYGFMRRQLNQGVLPQKDAIRLEELINYFDYAYPLPETKEVPFKPSVVVTDSPWSVGKKLVHIGIKGYDIDPSEQPRSNLVFLLDVSGSMNSPDKLPLVKQSMDMLLSTLNPDDTVSIVVYAGAAGTVLEPTKVKDKQKILNAIKRLNAGGSTAGGQGIELAYDLAENNFDKDAVNRIILATDGDFNVGINNREHLKDFVERKRDKGIFLSVLGFGQGNYNDHMMQSLAQNGNGVAAYIDSLSEAQKVLVDEATSTLFPIAKDVKIQVEFNPNTVAEYRLIGYETRALAKEDFNNDAVDAGDIGAGHTVTAIYEITPVGSNAKLIDESRYAPKFKAKAVMAEDVDSEYAFLKIRYKLPEESKSKLITTPISDADDVSMLGAERPLWLTQETGFATAVASFGQILKGGKYTGSFDYDAVIKMAQATKGADPYGYRTEFIQLVRKAKMAKGL